MENNEKLTLIVFSGDFDKAVAAFTLASGAAAMNKEVNMFFTFWGLNLIKRKHGRSPIGKGILAKMFNFLMGGLKNLPLSRLNFLGISPILMTYMMKKKNVATLSELIAASKALNVNFIACEMAMHIMELKKEDLIPEVKEIVGVPTFLARAQGGMTLFV